MQTYLFDKQHREPCTYNTKYSLRKISIVVVMKRRQSQKSYRITKTGNFHYILYTHRQTLQLVCTHTHTYASFPLLLNCAQRSIWLVGCLPVCVNAYENEAAARREMGQNDITRKNRIYLSILQYIPKFNSTVY